MQFIQDNVWMLFIAISSGLMLLWSFFGNRWRGIKEIDSVAALQLINHKNALVLDVREEKEYKAGHVLNAKLIPLGKLGERKGELERNREQPIVVMCASGQRSASACVLLEKEGFAKAYNLTGGINAWKKAGLPLEK